MIDISNFKSFRFSIFCLSNFVLYACIDVPYVCLPDQVITSGAFAKEGASYLISILGVSNTLGVVSERLFVRFNSYLKNNLIFIFNRFLLVILATNNGLTQALFMRYL